MSIIRMTKKLMKRQINIVKNSVLNKLGKIDEDQPLKTPRARELIPNTNSNEKLNVFAHEFIPNTNGYAPTKCLQSDEGNEYKKIAKFVPKHSARAKFNIYIPKNMTKKLLSKIAEEFPNTGTLYYYLDISTAFQINDDQMNIMQKSTNDEKLVFINFDLHKKETRELLYGVIIPNDQHKIEAKSNKWLWKLDRFLTAKEIKNEYNIFEDDLPQSSRSMTNGVHSQCKLQQQLIDNESIDIGILDDVDWTDNTSIKQFVSAQKGKKAKKKRETKIVLDEKVWINECQKSWNNIPAIPIAVYQNKDSNEHWIEWVKLIYIPSQNSYVGVSFKYNQENRKWNVESIYLDKGDIRNKHRLIRMNESEEFNYSQYFDKFNTTITEIEWK